MRKLLTALLVLVFALGASGCGDSKEPPAPTPPPAAKSKLVVGLDDHFPPMGFRDADNNIVGFDIDLAKEVGSILGMEVEFQPIDWKVNIPELNAGNVDCLWNGFTLLESRKQELACSDPYMKNRQIIVVKADATYATLSDLAGKKLALQSGSSAQEALDSAAEFKDSLGETLLFDDNMRALMDLDAGGCDAVLMDEIVARYYVTQEGKYKVMEDSSLAEEEYGIGFRKTDTELRDQVNEALKTMKASGKMAEISEKWFSQDITIIQAAE